ncbi:MAG: hypothetical protein R3F43_17710 [bacterium]
MEDALTAAGSVVGTPPTWRRSTGAGSRPQSDLYAVGVLLYRMLAGRTPFQGKPMVLSTVPT